MRILQISSIKNFGGGERHLVELAKGLNARRGHEIFICLRKNAEWKNRLSFLPPENLFELPLRNSIDVFSAYKIAEFIRQKNIEIVHAHAARDYPIAAFAARLSSPQTRLVLTRHLLFPLKPFYKFLLPENTNFIAVSKVAYQKLLEQKFVSIGQIWLIYNGIDTVHFQTVKKNINREKILQKLNLPPKKLLVGMVGEIAPHKGQTEFAHAAAIVLEQFPDAEFLIVGREIDAHRQYAKELKKLIEELGLQNKIHFLGNVTDIAPVFSILDVFVSASRFESFGLAIAEAMASGCAVVAASTEGAKELVQNNKTGKLVPLKNKTALAATVTEFLQNENMRKTYGEAAQKAVKEKFDVRKMVDETEMLYNRILMENKQKNKS